MAYTTMSNIAKLYEMPGGILSPKSTLFPLKTLRPETNSTQHHNQNICIEKLLRARFGNIEKLVGLGPNGSPYRKNNTVLRTVLSTQDSYKRENTVTIQKHISSFAKEAPVPKILETQTLSDGRLVSIEEFLPGNSGYSVTTIEELHAILQQLSLYLKMIHGSTDSSLKPCAYNSTPLAENVLKRGSEAGIASELLKEIEQYSQYFNIRSHFGILIHGDAHFGNILIETQSYSAGITKIQGLIDWDTSHVGSLEEELYGILSSFIYTIAHLPEISYKDVLHTINAVYPELVEGWNVKQLLVWTLFDQLSKFSRDLSQQQMYVGKPRGYVFEYTRRIETILSMLRE